MDSDITINGETPNLFRRLLAYRPRADRDSRENFLTESFAYLLAKDSAVALKIVTAMVEGRFQLKRITSIRTQVSLGDASSRGLLDMKIEALDRNGNTLQIWIENKWDSPADVDQINRYIAYLRAHDSKSRLHLVLLTPRHTDAKLCSIAGPGISLTHLTWSKIQEILATHRASGIAKEFERFLNEQRLAVQSITLAAAQDHRRRLADKSGLDGNYLLENLWTLCSRVRQQLTTTALTKDAGCSEGYGRVALWMFGGRMSLGVLFDPADHATEFLDERRPLDLIVRIEGPYKKANSEPARAKLSPLVTKLERVGYACEQHRRLGNHHTLVLGHYREGFPFNSSADEQVARLTEIFDSTQLLIANDKRLMSLLDGVKRY